MCYRNSYLSLCVLLVCCSHSLFAGEGGCPSEGPAIVGDNLVDTTRSSTTIDLTGYCSPGPYGAIYYNAVTYSFIPPEDGTYVFSTCSLVDFDSKLGLFAGTNCDPSTAIACNDDTSGCSSYTTELFVPNLVAGEPYIILVGGYGSETAGSGILRITLDTTEGFGMEIEATLTPSPPVANADYGESVVLDGDHLLVGAPYGGQTSSSYGSVFLYQSTGVGDWYQSARFEVESGQDTTYQYFGRYGLALDSSQGRVTAGAPYAGATGELRIYESKGSSTWSQSQILVHPQGKENQTYGFGWCSAISGDLIAVGDTWGSGSVVLFRKVGDLFYPEATFDGATIAEELGIDEFYSFGDRVALEDDVLIISAPYAPGNYGRQGMSFIYEQLDKKNLSAWTRTAILYGSSNQSRHGLDIELVQGRLFISEPYANSIDIEAGQILVYDRTAPGVWEEQQPLLPTVLGTTNFGSRFTAERDQVAIGSQLFRQDLTGKWVAVTSQELEDQEGTTYWTDVSMSGNRLAIGADEANLDGYTSGAVYILDVDALTDCDGDGLDDDDAILSGIASDCDQDGKPDSCQFGFEVAQQVDLLPPGGLVQTAEFDELLPPATGLRIQIDVIGDLDSYTEFLALSLNGVPEGILFAETGINCPAVAQTHQLFIEFARAEELLKNGNLSISIASSGTVDPAECANGQLSVSIYYYGMPQMPDCDSDGVSDWCALIRGATDCNGNMIPDMCDVASGELLDCDADGLPDECGEYSAPDIDCDGDGLSDLCTFGAYTPSAKLASATIFWNGTGQQEMLSMVELELDPTRPLVDRFVIDVPDGLVEWDGYKDHVGRPITIAIWRGNTSTLGPEDLELYWSEIRTVPATAPIVFDIDTIDLTELDGEFWIGVLYAELEYGAALENITPISFSNDDRGPDHCWVGGGPVGTTDLNDLSTTQYPWYFMGNQYLWSLGLRLLPVGEVEGDCDRNGRYDPCQVADDVAGDKDGNGQPDVCQFARGDLDLDGQVDGADLTILLSLWGFINPPVGDLNNDGFIDGADLSILLSWWS